MNLRAELKVWRADPVAFCEALVNPETGLPFKLYPEQKRFIRQAVKRGKNGRMLYPELVFSAPKKSGKTAYAGMFMLYVIFVLGGKFAEAYAAANDLEQSQGRVYQAACRIIEATKWLATEANVTTKQVTIESTGATMIALANDYAGSAGANPTITTFDELWAFKSEAAHRFWDEMVPPPTRVVALRLTTTYAGFEGESDLLEALYKSGLKGRKIGRDLYSIPGQMLMYWTHELRAPWQSEEWRAQMKATLRPNAYLRLIENRWVSGEESFVDFEQWQRCIAHDASPVVADALLQVDVGVDASTKRDSTAIVATCWDHATKRVRLVTHRIFQPSQANPIDFERDVEATILELKRRFRVRVVRFDPYQMAATAQRLIQAGVPMEEFAQTVGNLTEASNNLFELIKGANLIVYDDAAINKAIKQTVTVETTRGWRLAKEKTSARIDVVVALAQAALATVQRGQIVPIDDRHFYVPDQEDREEAQADLQAHMVQLQRNAMRGDAPWDF